jgi:hypothetical protein
MTEFSRGLRIAITALGVVALIGLPSVVATAAAPTNASSSSYAGYLLTYDVSAQADVGGDFVVPELTCSSDEQGLFIGAVVYTAEGMSESGIETTCAGGTASYDAAIYFNGFSAVSDASVPVGADVFVHVIEEVGGTHIVFQVHGKGGWTLIGTRSSGFAPTSALAGVTGVDSDGVQLPIPQFAKIHFGPVKEDQTTPAAAGAVAVNMSTSGGVLQVKTGPLNSNGNRWTETFKHS